MPSPASIFPFNPSFPFGIGIDLLHIVRLQQLILRRTPHVLAKRILSAHEYELFGNKFATDDQLNNGQCLHYLGVRWAAKEAAYKAAGYRQQALTWKDVEVRYKGSGQPYLAIEKDESWTEGLLSISHDGEYITAMAMVQSDERS